MSHLDPERPYDPLQSPESVLAFMQSEWGRIWQTKTSLEQRAIALITTSGVLVTLVFGFVAAVTKSKNLANFTSDEKILIGVALGLFVACAAIALWINVPKSWDVPQFPETLGRSPSDWGLEPSNLVPIDRFVKAADQNWETIDTMSRRLAVAFLVEILAILTLATGVLIVIE